LKSRKSTSRKKPRILIDTSFSLPALGVEVEEGVLNAISLFRKVEVFYLELSLVEAMWKVLKRLGSPR